jgi:hypothetical protein
MKDKKEPIVGNFSDLSQLTRNEMRTSKIYEIEYLEDDRIYSTAMADLDPGKGKFQSRFKEAEFF